MEWSTTLQCDKHSQAMLWEPSSALGVLCQNKTAINTDLTISLQHLPKEACTPWTPGKGGQEVTVLLIVSFSVNILACAPFSQRLQACRSTAGVFLWRQGNISPFISWSFVIIASLKYTAVELGWEEGVSTKGIWYPAWLIGKMQTLHVL